MQGVHLRKYGVETKIDFELYEVDGVDLRVDAVDAGSDCNIMKDEGAEATCTNDFVDEGMGYSITLTATEMEAARIVLYIIDSATKVWLDKVIVIETYGNASAMHALDLDTAIDAAGTAATPAEVATALTDIDLDHLINTSVADEVADNSIIAKLVSKDATADWSDYSWQTESLEALKDGVLADILTDTAEIGVAGAGLTNINLPNQTMDIVGNITGNLSGSVGSLTGHTVQTGDSFARIGVPAGASVSADIAAVPTVNEIWAKAMSDLAQGAPSATASVLTAINYLYEAWRNKTTTTATLITIMKDDGTTGLVKSTISDDATTFTKGEMATGA